jgi:hypothetical protein
MRGIGVILITILATILIFGACAKPTVAPAPEPELAPAPESAPQPEPTPTPKQATPKPGEWVASTKFGELRFTVNSSSTGITKIHLEFDQFKCGGVTWESGGVTFENASPSPISGGKFTVEAYVNPWDFVVQGEFDETGMYVSGIWQVRSKGCSGEWESSRMP